MKNNFNKNIVLWLILGLVAIISFGFFQTSKSPSGNLISYSKFLSELENNQLQSITLQGGKVTGYLKNSGIIQTYALNDPDFIKSLKEHGVEINVLPPSEKSPSLFQILISWFPFLLLIGVWIFFMRQMGGGKGGAMGFGKSKARLLDQKKKKVTFVDVAGIDEAKQELSEVVDFLKNPQKFQRLGAKIPTGVLLMGPPGTGKTLLARAIAGEASVPFFSISGSDFVEMFVGVGASRVRDMFSEAKKSAPCIIFIDEIDAVGRHRGAGLGGGNDEREQTLNQMLVEMDGFENNTGVIVMAATNRADVLDPALLRPGRFDRQVIVPNPDVKGREHILNVHLRKVPQAKEINSKVIARGTPGFSGADLANLVNEAALIAAKNNRLNVTMRDLENAKDKVMMGTERRSMAMTDEEKKITAYHEAGHALTGLHLEESDEIHKATIIPRGRALGMVIRLPENDRISVSKAKLQADLVVAMGGRVAEEEIFGYDKITTGASNDIKVATDMTKRMVCEWGMSEKMGTVAYHANQDEVFLGRSISREQNISEKVAQEIDGEIRRFMDEAYQHAKQIIRDYRHELEIITNGLIKYETLSGEEIKDLIAGKELSREDDDDGKEQTQITSVLPQMNNDKNEPAEENTPDKDNKKSDNPFNE